MRLPANASITSQIKAIEPGRTTRADIGTILGDPTFDDERAVAYVWEKPITHIVWGWAIPVPVWLWASRLRKRPPLVTAETITKGFVFFILYDDTGRVVTFERKRLSEYQDPRNEFHDGLNLLRS